MSPSGIVDGSEAPHCFAFPKFSQFSSSDAKIDIEA